MKNMKRSVALLVAIALLIGCAAGGTMAWLTMKTDSVVNTFTTSDVSIELTETTGDTYKMIPNASISKNPVVKVSSDSEDCYVFVKIEKLQGNVTYTPAGSSTPVTTTWDQWLSFAPASTWNAVPDESNVYYMIFDADDSDNTNVKGTPYSVLADNKVTVNKDVTKEMMAGVTDSTKPKLEFTAYAIQLDYLTDANGDSTVDVEDAWQLIYP